MTFTIDFDEVSLTVTKRINAKFGTHADKDDALQEALIRTWKDVESKKYDYNHIVNRAETWARKYLFPGANAQKSTGSSRVTTDGFARRPEMREKIRLFRDEYRKLHGTNPTHKATGQALGLSASTIGSYLKRMNTVEPIKAKDGRRIDYGAYNFKPLLDMRDESDDEYNSRVAIPSFEADLMDDLSFQELIKALDYESKRAFVLHFECDWSFTDIGYHLWPDSPSWIAARSRAQRLFYKAKADLKAHLS